MPPVSEVGVPGYEATIWLGLMAPKGSPAAVVNRLNAELSEITSRAGSRSLREACGFEL